LPHAVFAGLVAGFADRREADGGFGFFEIRAGRNRRDANGKARTEIGFDVRGFVTAACGVPRVKAQQGEITGLAFAAEDAGSEVLRLQGRLDWRFASRWLFLGAVLLHRVGNAVKLEPGDEADSGGEIAERCGQVQLDEAADHPAGEVAGIRITAANEQPVFLAR